MDIGGIVSQLESNGALHPAAQSAGVQPQQAGSILQGVLEHFDRGGAPEGMVASVASRVGVSPQQVEALLPQVLPLLEGHAQSTGGSAPGLGGLLGSLRNVL